MKLNHLVAKKYLDSDQRPGAVALTPSKANVIKKSDFEFSFAGELGAIKGDILAKHVGFIGIEFSFESIVVQDLSLLLKSLKVSNISSNQKQVNFTFQVINQEGQRFAFEKEVFLDKINQIDLGENESKFTGTWRGKYQSEVKLRSSDKIKGLVVCLRRSQNNPNEIKPITVHFNLSFV